ncbi:MAG: hydroxymethylpyrimidine/phosphomethylpyrimidine kinase [Chromatiales bacterium]|nr:hydroxymethylpyrimidine/phosphomethylpyrimidine kinase [Chromatiales bacterium]
MNPQSIPIVLSIAGVDPTGGAGLQADIEAITSMGCHACPVVAAVTVQDTHDVKLVKAMPASLVVAQARAVLEDMPVHAIKLGLLGSVEIIQAVHTLLTDYPELPVVLDPILAAGGGTELGDAAMLDAMRTLLVPQATVITPNSLEVRRLAPGADTLDACATALLDRGADLVLVTGTHEQTPQVRNSLHVQGRPPEHFTWERLDGSYHGSGCTLASAIAGLLAQGQEPFSAIHEAQEYTWQSLAHGYRLGMGQLLPNRLFWAEAEE